MLRRRRITASRLPAGTTHDIRPSRNRPFFTASTCTTISISALDALCRCVKIAFPITAVTITVVVDVIVVDVIVVVAAAAAAAASIFHAIAVATAYTPCLRFILNRLASAVLEHHVEFALLQLEGGAFGAVFVDVLLCEVICACAGCCGEEGKKGERRV